MPDLRLISNSAVWRTPGKASAPVMWPLSSPREASCTGGLSPGVAEASVTIGFAGGGVVLAWAAGCSFERVLIRGAGAAEAGVVLNSEAKKLFFVAAIGCCAGSPAVT